MLINQSGSNRQDKNRMIQLLQQKLKNEKEDPSITRLNQSILQARKHFPLAESAKAIQNSVFLKKKTYFSLYAVKEMKEDGFEVEPDYSIQQIEVVWLCFLNDKEIGCWRSFPSFPVISEW